MEDVHRKAIQSNFTSLVETTDLDSMVTALYERRVFSEQMIEPYRDVTSSQRDRKRLLYLDIEHRGPQAFGKLLDVLKELGYWNLVRDLDPASPLHPRPARPPRSSHDVPRPLSNGTGDSDYISIGNQKDIDRETESVAPLNVPDTAQASLTTAGNNTTQPFVVHKSTKFIDDDECKELRPYRTRGRHRGVLLLFSYVSFKHNIERYRRGVEVDCANLKHLFSEMGFKVLSYMDLSKKETENTLRAENLRQVVAGAECVFVVVSSHGHEVAHSSDVEVRCSDGALLPLRQLIGCFGNRRLPMMHGVPKVFVVQMCRGSKTETQFSERAELDGTAAPAELDGMLTELDGTAVPPGADAPPGPAHADLSPFSDILIAQSTLPGFVSHRDPQLGSWYIQALCAVFASRAHDTDVDKLFKLVDQQLDQRFRRQTSAVTTWRFNRRLYLHPGLHE